MVSCVWGLLVVAVEGSVMADKPIVYRSHATTNLRVYLGLAILFLLLSGVALYFDLTIAAAHQTNVLPGDLRRIIRLSEVFAHGFGLTVIVLSIWLLAPELRRRLPRLILCGVLASASAQVMKLAFVRLRPMAYRINPYQIELPDTITQTWTRFDEQLNAADVGISYYVQAFPSAHAAMAVGVTVGLCWLLPRGRWLFFLLAILACYQRIQSHAHWASDVFAGAAIGTLVAGLLLQDWGLGWVMTRYENRADSVSETTNENVTP